LQVLCRTGTSTPTSSTVIRLDGCRSIDFEGGESQKLLLESRSFRILRVVSESTSTIARCSKVSARSSRPMEVEVQHISNMGNVRYQLGVSPTNYFQGTKRLVFIVQGSQWNRRDTEGNQLASEPLVSGLISSVEVDNASQNSVYYVANAISGTGVNQSFSVFHTTLQFSLSEF